MRISPRLGAAHRAAAEGAAIGPLLQEALLGLGRPRAQLNCLLAGDATLRALNRRFAGRATATDVLAFPAPAAGSRFRLPPGAESQLGDVVISVPLAVRQAGRASQSADAELRLLAVHGLLHLLGHDHARPAEARRMTVTTRRLLAAAAHRSGRPEPVVAELRPSA
ncbi:MAG: rRNA maturation RNase YbeY [Candidatus Dormibacteria bacterium]